MSARHALTWVLVVAAPLAAQRSERRSVDGRVMRASATAMVAMPGVWVVLHRVGRDRQGPVDSARTDAHGAFRITYAADGDDGAVYFLAALHDGIAYLSSPLRQPRVSGADAEIDVYDTTSSGITLRERGRHIIALAPRPDGWREVIEVYELENPTRRTLVPATAGRAAWTAPLPAGAIDVRAEQGDVSPEALTAAAGRVQVLAPFAPGLKQVGFAYRLPVSAFPLTLPASRDTAVLEILVEEKGAAAVGAGLRRVDDQTVDGHQLARYLSPNAPGGATAVITAASANVPRAPLAPAVLVVLMAIMMTGALTFGLRRTA